MKTKTQWKMKFIGQLWLQLEERTLHIQDILQCCGSAIKLMTYYNNF